ncbi:MAG: hypothetical protein ACOCWL_02110 [Thermoguttaceae bacterium]
MKISTILFAVVFSAVATVWSAGPEVAPAEPNGGAEATEPTADEPQPTELSESIRQFVDDLRWGAIERWFDHWDAAEPHATDDVWPDLPAEDGWWDDALAAPPRRAVVEAEADGLAVGAAASGRGTAISMAVVDDHYEIEAAWSGPEGPERYRVRGTREEVERWAAQLPQPLKRAVRRQLASTDFDGPAW